MKKIISTLCLILAVLSVTAQGIYIYQPSGRLRLTSAELDSIVPSTGNYIVYKADGTTLSLPFAKVDSLVAFEIDNSELIEYSGKNAARVNLDAAKTLSDVQTAINEANDAGVTKYTISGDFDNIGIVQSGNTISNPFQNTNATEIDMSGVTNFTSLPDYAFYKVSKIEKLTLPKTVKTLGKRIFYNCTKLKTIIAKGVTTFGKYAFCDPAIENMCCKELTTVDMPELTSIPYCGFWRTNITEANFPKLTEISSAGLRGCKKLTKVNLKSVKTIADQGLYGCTALTEIDMPALEEIGKNAFAECALTSVKLPALKKMANNAFTGCDDLETVDLPELTESGGGVFASCSSLTSVSMPKLESLTPLEGNFLFQFCSSLKTIELPSLKATAGHMFATGCSSLTSVSMPIATDIAESTFRGCSALTSVNLPAAKTIGKEAFYRCESIVSLDLPSATTIGEKSFYNCSSLASLNLPAATSLGKNIDGSCNSLTTLKLTASGDISIDGITNDSSSTLRRSRYIDLTLNADKKSEVTMPGADAESWELPEWKGLSFKSISFEE